MCFRGSHENLVLESLYILATLHGSLSALQPSNKTFHNILDHELTCLALLDQGKMNACNKSLALVGVSRQSSFCKEQVTHTHSLSEE